ncbi:aminotransferase class IV family protein [Streptomyces sp. NBC_00344]|uniref:aminotransferase class IV family protein n=1 Tax=Streptomyces sp. NBC_00344 TaxID=2975720 RepID=UPI002E1EAAE7
MELNGQPADPAALRALALTNYGHFTTMRVDDGRVRGLALHLERLDRDCRAVFGTVLDTTRVRELVRRAVTGPSSHGSGTFLVRVSVFDPDLDIVRPSAPATPHVLITTRPAGPLPPAPLRVKSVPHVRDLPAVKHFGLFGALHARRAAQLDGFDDALFHGPDDRVSEGGTWNVGFVDGDGRVVWPSGDVLPGVTMALLKQHHPHTTRPVTVEEARGMQAVFATSTGIGVRAVSAVDTRVLSTGHPVAAALRSTYLALPGEVV